MKVAVIGAGAWGTALAAVLSRNGHHVTLWAHNPAQLRALEKEGRNERHLPGIDLPPGFEFEPDLPAAASRAEAVLMAVPSKAVRETASRLPGSVRLIISVIKGIEYGTGLTMSSVIQQCAPQARLAALSGPTFALEVARRIPSAIVSASESSELAEQVQALFHSPVLRVYTSQDLIGVELGGALKNVIAIAAGLGDGLGYGDNTKAALITRAIAEMRRLGVACGAQPETFSGLSGLGDLVATCFSKLSRNRGFGERLGRGEKPDQILAAATSVAEGYPTTRSAWQLARKMGVSTPIIAETHAVLYEGKDPASAVRDLTARGTKAED